MADSSEDELLLLQQQAAAALLLSRRRYRKKRQIWVREVFLDRLRSGDYCNLIPKLRESWFLRRDPLFVETFRMTPVQFDFLLSLVESELQHETTHLRQTISPAERQYITLRFLATGDLYRSLSLAYRVGKSTISCIVPETCEAIWRCLQPLYVKAPDKEDMENIAKGFLNRWNFPNCVGALDGKHVRLTAPPNAGSMYYNYKEFNSIVLMATCDADLKFTTVDIGSYGRVSDGGVFASSPLGQATMDPKGYFPNPRPLPNTNQEMPFCLVTDDAFPLKENMMKPYPGRGMTDEERIFNYRLSRARRCIENAFGVLATRWRVLRNDIMLFPERAISIVQATICLHNMLLSKDASERYGTYNPIGFSDYVDVAGNIHEGEWRAQGIGNGLVAAPQQGSNTYSRSAKAIRDSFRDYFSGPGAVAWQRDRACIR